jgi:hypothetical protein
MNVFDYKPLEKDYRIWLVLNPAVWLMPILIRGAGSGIGCPCLRLVAGHRFRSCRGGCRSAGRSRGSAGRGR